MFLLPRHHNRRRGRGQGSSDSWPCRLRARTEFPDAQIEGRVENGLREGTHRESGTGTTASRITGTSGPNEIARTHGRSSFFSRNDPGFPVVRARVNPGQGQKAAPEPAATDPSPKRARIRRPVSARSCCTRARNPKTGRSVFGRALSGLRRKAPVSEPQRLAETARNW